MVPMQQYQWCNHRILDRLLVSGSNGVLTFEVKTFSGGFIYESAEVMFDDSGIIQVALDLKGDKKLLTKNDVLSVYGDGALGNNSTYHWLKPGGDTLLRLGYTRRNHHGGYHGKMWPHRVNEFESEPEPGFEMVYFYLIRGGPGVQVGIGMWCNGTPANACWFVSDRSWGTVPMGLHPVCAIPGSRVSYIWAFLAKKPEWEKLHGYVANVIDPPRAAREHT